MQQICIGIGQAGVQLLSSYHTLHPNQHRTLLFIDNDPQSISSVQLNHKLSSKSFIKGKNCSAANWMESYCCSNLNQQIRQKYNHCLQKLDQPSGIKFFFSLTGGTGTSLIRNCFEDSGKLCKMGFVVWPNMKYGSFQNVVGPYNTMLGLKQLNQKLDMNIILQNEQFYKNFEDNKYFTYKDLNQLMVRPLYLMQDMQKIKHSMCIDKYLKIFTLCKQKQYHYSSDYKRQNSSLITSLSLSNSRYYQPKIIKVNNSEQINADILTISLNTNIRYRLRKIECNYTKLYRTRSFVHWYVGIGLSEGFFEQAYHQFLEYKQKYQQYICENEI